MNQELLAHLQAVEKEKGVDRNFMVETLRMGVLTAIRKMAADEPDLYDVEVDPETIEIKIKKEGKEIYDTNFSRIAAQTAKQVILQKLREAEREAVYQEYKAKVGDIITGEVHRIESQNIIVYLGEVEAILPRREQIRKEEYRQGQTIKAYLVDVRKTSRGPDVVLSRTHPNFVKRLFELEVPEISEGIVQIKGVAREAGARTKIAVYSQDDKIDSVGSCVGMRGQRVKNIVLELNGEKIDIVRWSADQVTYLKNALSPAQLDTITLKEDKGIAEILVKDDQLSLAIGKKGQNVRLSSKLTGWILDIRSTSEKAFLKDLEGVGEKTEKILKEHGITTVKDLLKYSVDDLKQFEGIGEKTAEKIIESAHQIFLTPSTQKSGSQRTSGDESQEMGGAKSRKEEIMAELDNAFKQSQKEQGEKKPKKKTKKAKKNAEAPEASELEEGSAAEENPETPATGALPSETEEPESDNPDSETGHS